MISKRLQTLMLFLPWMCLLGWTLLLFCTRANGTDVTVAITGYDPLDLLSGHYIAYQPYWTHTDCQQFTDVNCPKELFCKEARWGEQCRFYIPQTDANALDQLFRSSPHNLQFEVIYSYLPGQTPLAKQLLINQIPWQQYLRENP